MSVPIPLADQVPLCLRAGLESRWTTNDRVRIALAKLVTIKHRLGRTYESEICPTGFKKGSPKEVFKMALETAGGSPAQTFVWLIYAISSLSSVDGWEVTWKDDMRCKDWTDYADALCRVHLEAPLRQDARKVVDLKLALMKAIYP